MNTSSSGDGIGENGVIVGKGVHNGETHAYAMVPVAVGVGVGVGVGPPDGDTRT